MNLGEKSVNKKSLAILCIIFIIPSLASCAMHHTPLIVKNLNSSVLNESFQTKPINLKVKSECKELPSVTIVNAETREVIPMGVALGLVEHDYNARELIDHVVNYIGDAFTKCKINVNANSGKIIKISLKDMKYMLGTWSQGASVEIKVNIPEINYSKLYAGIGNAYGGTPVAAAYAIHEVTWKLINDPVIQDYILCAKTATNENLPVGESALDILKRRYANGEITKEQFEQMKKDIQ
jgi:uncharacterized membrane protein